MSSDNNNLIISLNGINNDYQKYFQFSRTLSPLINSNWISKIFDNLENKPRDTLYSIAFYLSFIPNEHFQSEESFSIASELFNLLDDLLNETDTLTIDELNKNRIFTFDFYKREIKEKDYKIFNTIKDNYLKFTNNLKNINFESDENFINNLSIEETKEIININNKLSLINNYIHIPNNLMGSILLKGNNEKNIKDNNNNNNIYFYEMTNIRRYLHYKDTLTRYEQLDFIIKLIENKRNINIIPILLPNPNIWQVGDSSILWILLHTITFLCRSRGNIYNYRLIVLLKNLSFFIKCVECNRNWIRTGGEGYFNYLYNIQNNLIYTIPLDIVLLKIHNNISRHCPIQKILKNNEIIELYNDYYLFVNKNILKRPVKPIDKLDYSNNRIIGVL